MARVGEGDPRWIVNERVDGNNVNQWHWDQKDKTESAKEALKAIFKDRSLYESPQFGISTTDFTGFNGDVTVANRKGRLRCFFEMKFTIHWKATSKEEDEVLATGKFLIHDCDTQNYVEDFSVDVSGEQKSGDMHNEVMKNVRSHGRQALRSIIRSFVDDELMKANGVCSQPMVSTLSTVVSSSKPQSEKTDSSSSSTSIKSTKTWYAQKKDIYECFTQMQKVSSFTRSPCQIDAVKGGSFSLLNDLITGEFLDLEENCAVIMRWRLSSWSPAEGKQSIVSIKLDGEDGEVKFSFEHTGIPSASLEQVKRGWEMNFWGPMKQILGYGSNE